MYEQMTFFATKESRCRENRDVAVKDDPGEFVGRCNLKDLNYPKDPCMEYLPTLGLF